MELKLSSNRFQPFLRFYIIVAIVVILVPVVFQPFLRFYSSRVEEDMILLPEPLFQPFLRFYLRFCLGRANTCSKVKRDAEFQPFLRFYHEDFTKRNPGEIIGFQPFLRFYVTPRCYSHLSKFTPQVSTLLEILQSINRRRGVLNMPIEIKFQPFLRFYEGRHRLPAEAC